MEAGVIPGWLGIILTVCHGGFILLAALYSYCTLSPKQRRPLNELSPRTTRKQSMSYVLGCSTLVASTILIVLMWVARNREAAIASWVLGFIPFVPELGWVFMLLYTDLSELGRMSGTVLHSSDMEMQPGIPAPHYVAVDIPPPSATPGQHRVQFEAYRGDPHAGQGTRSGNGAEPHVHTFMDRKKSTIDGTMVDFEVGSPAGEADTAQTSLNPPRPTTENNKLLAALNS